MSKLMRNLCILTAIWPVWDAQIGLAEDLSKAQPHDQIIVVATAGNSVQRRFVRTVDVLLDGVLVLISGQKVDMKGRSNDEIADALMEAAVELPADRKGELLLYRQPVDEVGVFVGGAVESPQFIPITQGLRLEEAIAAVGGRTLQADDRILIIRSDGQKFSSVYSSVAWGNTLLFSRDRIIVFYRENEG